MLLDFSRLNDDQANESIYLIYKSMHNHGDDGIWKPHDSPYIKRLIELFTQRGLTRLDGVKEEINAWLDGKKHTKGGSTLAQKPDMMRRWTPTELGLVKLYLETLPPDQWTIGDYEMLVEFVVQRYLPEDVLRTEAEWLATKSNLMGRVQANMEKMTETQADKVLAALPSTVSAAASAFAMNSAQQATLAFGAAHACEWVVDLSNSARAAMRSTILNYIEKQMLGSHEPGTPSLQSTLLMKFDALNRDWRRIAVTEAGNCALVGYIASLKPGVKVRRSEQYNNACSFCKKIDGMIMEVVDANNPDKDPETQIWVGKDNYGRSQSPKKVVNGVLIDRTPEEMWQVPAGLVHPHCRGRWVPVIEGRPGDDPEFGDYLRNLLSPKKA